MGRLKFTTTNRSGDTINVRGILIDPSAASWVLIIMDTAGNTVFSAKGADAVTRYYPIVDTWVGANVTTSTNITAAFIYTD